MKNLIIAAVMFTLLILYGCKCMQQGCKGCVGKHKVYAYSEIGAIDPNCSDTVDCYVNRIRDQMENMIAHLRADALMVSEPQAKALFETSADVIDGLNKAMNDYQAKNKGGWKSEIGQN